MKTIKRHCFDSFVLSSEKMNEYATRFLQLEEQSNRITYTEDHEEAGEALKTEVKQQANKKVVDFDEAEIVETKQLNEAQPNNVPAPPAEAEKLLFNDSPENDAEHPNF